jgi:S1-C subfamily serine protease
MKNLLIAFFLISFYSCQENVEDKKQKEIITKEVVSDTIKTVDNDMINFLSLGNFMPDFLKTLADRIDLQYVDYNNHNLNLRPTTDNNPFLIKILENYLDNNSVHPIEGIYDLIHNGEVGFKVFIYKSNYLDGFLVNVIENRNYSFHLETLERYKISKKQKIAGYPERTIKELSDQGIEYDYWWENNAYPFQGQEATIYFGDKYMWDRFFSTAKDSTKPIYKSNVVKELMYFHKNKGDLYLKFLYPNDKYTEDVIDRLYYQRAYAYIENTSNERNYIINWFSDYGTSDWFQSPPSIAEFSNNILRFIVKGAQGRYGIAERDKSGNTYKASFLKTYPVDGVNSKSYNESNWAGNGSGLIISKQGHIVTNHHVINGAKSIEVEFKNDDGLKKYDAVVVNSDEETDLAILKINDDDFKEFDETPNYNFKSGLADSGEVIYAYGYPMALSAMGKEVKITDGIISSKTGINGDVKTYQISAPIQPGNSGGPLFDEKGNLIGINSSGLSKEIADNVGYTIKTNYLINLIDVLPEKIELPYSYTIRWLSNQKQIKRLSKYTVLIKVK